MGILTLVLQVAATLAMVGLIWFVQIVHYPLFSRVGRDAFRRYEMDHQRLTTYVVAPLMLTELFSATLLLWWPPIGVSTAAIWTGLGILVSIWLCTYVVQVPQHAALILSYDRSKQQQLVRGNWFRTIAWSARGILVLWMMAEVASQAEAGHAINSLAGIAK